MPSYPAVQSGVAGFGGAWTDAIGETLAAAGFGTVGFQFESFPFVQTSTSAGYFGAPAENRYRHSSVFSSAVLSLTLAGAVAPILWSVDLVDLAAPTPFVTGSTPNTLPLVSDVFSGTITAAPFLTTLSLDLLTFLHFRTLQTNSGWQGRFAFRIRHTVFTADTFNVLSHLSATPPTITTVEVPFETGLSGAEWAGHGIREDTKTGQWVARDRAQRDGYSRRQWVDPENYDPPDWETERRRRQPLREGRSERERDR